MTLYEALRAAGVVCDHHESDLYFEDTPESREILSHYPEKWELSSRFLSQIDGSDWIEVPFAYTPWWRDKARTARQIEESRKGAA